MIRNLRVCATAVMLTVVAASAQERVPEWLQEANRLWFEALSSGDASRLARLYSSDAVSITASRTLRGRDAIEAFHRGNFEKSTPKCTWRIHGAHVLEKQAAAWGTDTCTETPRSGAAAWTSQTRWLTIYERQADGSWLIVRESYDLVK